MCCICLTHLFVCFYYSLSYVCRVFKALLILNDRNIYIRNVEHSICLEIAYDEMFIRNDKINTNHHLVKKSNEKKKREMIMSLNKWNNSSRKDLVFALRWNASLRCFKQRNDFIFHCALNKIKMDFTWIVQSPSSLLKMKKENKNTFFCCLNFGICMPLYDMLTHVDCWSILNWLQLFVYVFTSEIPKAV